MALNEHVSITITQDSLGLARAGFGVPLILSANASFAERVRSYSDIASVSADFAAGTPEYRAADAVFGQDPHPETIRIGRSALKPTLRYSLTVGVVRNSYTYRVKVTLPSGTTEVTFASDASATDGEIATGLVAAINGVAGNNYIAAGTTSPFTVTADNAGDWFAIEVNPADITMSINHADPGVATDLAAIFLEDSSWYALYTLYNSEDYVKAAAAWVQSNKRMYLADSPDTIAVNTASDGTQGLLDDLKALAYPRTAGMYHPRMSEMPGAGWLGRGLPYDPGSETWAYKPIVGATPASLTSTNRLNLDNRFASYYKAERGLGITWQGRVASGSYIDITRSLDWLEDDMALRIFQVLASVAKVPYTDEGIAIIAAQMRGSLRYAVSRGVLVDDDTLKVVVPRVANISTIDKGNRLLPDVKFSGTLQGAIHRVNINGVVSL